ncbi:unnamed protein product [Adineta steineri]|uniref:Uncharacterized protein n=1 Tax=Adineta steineri TaxID=433720 RepID=A0A814WN85_9BILA|nr:unnamed protein product [Adineta steineri]CAF1207881.1 unnamed protein product [Adineta steineri]CAF1219034.1 unnamed protein product [Adineta steineri]
MSHGAAVQGSDSKRLLHHLINKRTMTEKNSGSAVSYALDLFNIVGCRADGCAIGVPDCCAYCNVVYYNGVITPVYSAVLSPYCAAFGCGVDPACNIYPDCNVACDYCKTNLCPICAV